MAIALRNKQMLALMLLAFATLLVVSYIVLYSAFHIDLWNLFFHTTAWQYPHG